MNGAAQANGRRCFGEAETGFQLVHPGEGQRLARPKCRAFDRTGGDAPGGPARDADIK